MIQQDGAFCVILRTIVMRHVDALKRVYSQVLVCIKHTREDVNPVTTKKVKDKNGFLER